MKCVICGAETKSATIVFSIGAACSDDCIQIAQGRRHAMIDQLKAEPLEEMPDQFETHDFERWAFKLSVHLIEHMTQQQKESVAPFLQVPEWLSLELKERILNHIPACYVSSVRSRGHERLFSSGTYCLRQPVPKQTVIEACQKAEILKKG